MDDVTITYRTINLELKKDWYLNYLKFVFESEDEPIKVKRCEELGKFLFSRVRTSRYPIPKPAAGTRFVKLVMPDHPNSTEKYKFMYYTDEDVSKIGDYIEAMAHLDHWSMVSVGREMGMNRKTIISVFSTLIFGEDSFDALAKDEYRKRKNKVMRLVKLAKEFGYT